MNTKNRLMIAGFFLAAVAVANFNATAASKSKLTSKPKKGSDAVELFTAVSDSQVDVRIIPKDATQATVIVSNKTHRPLSIRMPEAFVGMPVLAQIGGGGGNLGGGGGGGGGGNQSFGGGMGGMGGGGGFFNVGPDKVGKMKVTTVCLEHGKEDPNPRVKYALRPITDFTDKPAVIEVCKALGRGEMDQHVAQAAAWHLKDGLSWTELANKVKLRRLNGTTEMFFTPQQIRVAMRSVQVISNQLAQTQSEKRISPGELEDAAQRQETTIQIDKSSTN